MKLNEAYWEDDTQWDSRPPNPDMIKGGTRVKERAGLRRIGRVEDENPEKRVHPDLNESQWTSFPPNTEDIKLNTFVKERSRLRRTGRVVKVEKGDWVHVQFPNGSISQSNSSNYLWPKRHSFENHELYKNYYKDLL